MKSTVGCGGHRWLENDKTEFGGTEKSGRHRWETEEQRHIHRDEHLEIHQEEPIRLCWGQGLGTEVGVGVRMESSGAAPH